MSWLYTILFSGLMISAPAAPPSPNTHNVAAPPVPAAAAPAVTRQDETEKFDQTYPFSSSGRLSISNVNGSIVVEAWDRSEVRVEYTKIASTKEQLGDVDVRIDARQDRMDIQTEYDNWKSRDGRTWRTGKLNVEFRLMVPRTAFLNEVETVNGSVTVSNFTNFTKISAVNGAVKATNLRGAANLSTVNGEVSADFDRLESGSKIALSTVNGKVYLMIPSDSNATITADSVNGSISNDFGLPVRKGKYVGRDLHGRIGSGDVRIKLDSVNGGLTIGHKNDGKPLSPATNLLPQKEKGDEDWEGDDDASLHERNAKLADQNARLNREVEKAVRDSQKETAKAVKAAQKDIIKIEPAISAIVVDSIVSAADAVTSAATVINSAQVQAKIDETMARERQARSRMQADAFFYNTLPMAKVRKETYAVKGTPFITVDAVGCAVRVRGWDRSEVQYRVTQFSDPRNTSPVAVTDSHTDSTVNVRVQNDSLAAREGSFDQNRRAMIEIFVPRRSDLKVKSNGEIRVDGVSGKLDLSGSDESINVRDAEGSLYATNSDGRIRVIGFNGEVAARTSDGNIDLEGDFTKLTANASEGAISLTLPEGASADLEANCPLLEGDGIALTRVRQGEDKSLYRIGRGGAKYQVRTGGEIVVRGGSTIRESN